jgi:hypothetical protein
MDTHRTRSERLFELFCGQHGIDLVTVPCEKTQTPDFELRRLEMTAIAEVKELQSNPEEELLFEQLTKEPSVAGWGDPRERIKRKIKDAYPQLKNRANGLLPTVLVLFDNGTFGGIDGTDIKNAMYGSETWRVTRRATHDTVSPHLANDGKLRVDRHRQLSAVACLTGSEHLQSLYVFHNVHARNPLPVTFFQRAECYQYTINLNTDQLPEWERIAHVSE